MSMSMGASSRWQPPEDCFVKYGEMVLRLYDFIIFTYDLYVMIKGLFEFAVIKVIMVRPVCELSGRKQIARELGPSPVVWVHGSPQREDTTS
jgi:hypothetical protein